MALETRSYVCDAPHGRLDNHAPDLAATHLAPTRFAPATAKIMPQFGGDEATETAEGT
jgi:hypothetical protein